MDFNGIGQAASQYAATAIRLDSQGNKILAIQYYQHAVDALETLVRHYVDYKLNRAYVERANAYRNRIRVLEKDA